MTARPDLRDVIDGWVVSVSNKRAELRCRFLGHSWVMYGARRDICLDCLTIVDEHPQGRGRDRQA